MKLVVFDVDGTLVDSQHLIVAAQAVAFAEVGMPAPERRIALSVVGLSLPQAFRRLVGEDGPVAELSERYKIAYNRLRLDPEHDEALFPGMGDLIDRLHARPGVALGIATGKSRRGVDRLLAHHGWEDRFVTTQSADDAPSKPDPGMLVRAMAEAGTAPAETLMIGDTTYDIGMAVAAGVVPIGVSWGYHAPGTLYRSGAVTVVDNASALDGLLAGLV
ncbi:HAD-IA family hydrolase [Methylobacterium sp. J-076]|uniref:HAD-IA family hydrolase n=1 Tax=Methylobacterium sp. J-076 TaxID=2836655 RepID=UPI001FBB8425|nr:HAD-IA family hydrolase [Methylobacterium sp. J-076]MCJ2011683.1 HAD-IA family hydrolase [Methylobacterium sp. J-076]